MLIHHSSITKVSSEVLKCVEIISTSSGKVDKVYIVYLGAKCIIAKQIVVCGANMYPTLTRAVPRFVLDKSVTVNAPLINTVKMRRIVKLSLM